MTGSYALMRVERVVRSRSLDRVGNYADGRTALGACRRTLECFHMPTPTPAANLVDLESRFPAAASISMGRGTAFDADAAAPDFEWRRLTACPARPTAIFAAAARRNRSGRQRLTSERRGSWQRIYGGSASPAKNKITTLRVTPFGREANNHGHHDASPTARATEVAPGIA